MKILTNKQIENIKIEAYNDGAREWGAKLSAEIPTLIGESIVECFNGDSKIFESYIADLLSVLVNEGVLTVDDGMEITEGLADRSRVKARVDKTKPKPKAKKAKK
jgi:hypothetical protein